MSHFTVLVIGDNIEKQLQPYHEFECDGVSDEFVINVDDLENVRMEYEEDTTRRFKSPDGEFFNPYDHRFYREPTPQELEEIGNPGGTGVAGDICYSTKDWGDGKGRQTRIHFMPEGFEEVELKTSESMSLLEYIDRNYERAHLMGNEQPDLQGKHKYGWVRVNAAGEVIEVIDRTNPNHKWDWWTIGGRWTGFFKLKPNAAGALGEGGLYHKLGMNPKPEAGYVDQVRKGDIDFDAMRAERASEAAENFDKAIAIINGREFLTLEQMREQHAGWEKARAAYWEQPVIAELREGFKDPFIKPDEFKVSRESYIRRAENQAGRTFAVLKDGNWYARGEMGWFACVSGEISEDEWSEKFRELIDSLPDDTLLTVVDCHT